MPRPLLAFQRIVESYQSCNHREWLSPALSASYFDSTTYAIASSVCQLLSTSFKDDHDAAKSKAGPLGEDVTVKRALRWDRDMCRSFEHACVALQLSSPRDGVKGVWRRIMCMDT